MVTLHNLTSAEAFADTGKITKARAKDIMEDVLKNLEKYGQENSLLFDHDGGSIAYDGKYMTFRLQIMAVDKAGKVTTPEHAQFLRVVNRHNRFATEDRKIKESWLNQTFSWGGEEYTLTGATTKAKKYPLLGTRTKDKARFKFSINHVVDAMKLKELQK